MSNVYGAFFGGGVLNLSGFQLRKPQQPAVCLDGGALIPQVLPFDDGQSSQFRAWPRQELQCLTKVLEMHTTFQLLDLHWGCFDGFLLAQRGE